MIGDTKVYKEGKKYFLSMDTPSEGRAADKVKELHAKGYQAWYSRKGDTFYVYKRLTSAIKGKGWQGGRGEG